MVGPRPEQPRYVEELRDKIPFYDLRHLVRPGLTGWAQVKYGYAGDEHDALEKLQYEFFYLRHQSLGARRAHRRPHRAKRARSRRPVSDQPFVSVVIPMLNEIGHIEPCVDGFLAQTYPAELIEILVVDGGSTDGSREAVLAIAESHPQVRLVDNPRRLAAAAANIGIAESTGEVLSFLSAHGVPDPDYIATSVRMLLETGAVGVGGHYVHEGTDPASRAIGLAMASPFGMASPHRSSVEREEVDTISHPTFHKQPMVEAGGYDESLLRNEDYEFNYRLRLAGGSLVFCPEISSVPARGSLTALARRFFAYGRWKATVMRRHPQSIQRGRLVPPAAVAGGAVLGSRC